jgi:hypothetical protein
VRKKCPFFCQDYNLHTRKRREDQLPDTESVTGNSGNRPNFLKDEDDFNKA